MEEMKDGGNWLVCDEIREYNGEKWGDAVANVHWDKDDEEFQIWTFNQWVVKYPYTPKFYVKL